MMSFVYLIKPPPELNINENKIIITSTKLEESRYINEIKIKKKSYYDKYRKKN